MAFASLRQATSAHAPLRPALAYSIRVATSSLGDALAFVDLARAVLRITYEQYRADMTAHSYRVEQPLFPEVLEFAPQELPTAIQLMEELSQVGFDFGDLGDGHYSIVEAPSFIAKDAAGFALPRGGVSSALRRGNHGALLYPIHGVPDRPIHGSLEPPMNGFLVGSMNEGSSPPPSRRRSGIIHDTGARYQSPLKCCIFELP